jgi:hypothetical protein
MPNDEMTTEEFEAMMSERAGKAKRNKFGAVRTQYNGRTYDSKVEARYAVKLDLLKSAGEIRSWIAQPTFKLGEDFTYRADFEVEEQSGKRHVVDVKGHETPRFRDVRRLWAKYGHCPLWIVKEQGVEIIAGAPF